MKLVIFHYHLITGGVTDVIRQAIAAFNTHWTDLSEVQIVVGSEQQLQLRRDAWQDGLNFPLNFFCYEELAYSYNKEVDEQHLHDFCERIYQKHGSHKSDEDVCWWVHNHSLGKSLFYTRAVLKMACDYKQETIFQMHDFCEESRPQNQLLMQDIATNLYPSAPNIRYAVINKRDYFFVQEALKKDNKRADKTLSDFDNFAYLANPAPNFDHVSLNQEQRQDLLTKIYSCYQDQPLVKGAPIWLYPVRGIRRKNVLEMALLNQLQDVPANFILTLGANSPAEKEYADTVESLYQDGIIQGAFGMGADIDKLTGYTFKHLFDVAQMIVSPSLKEGFGYLFLTAIQTSLPVLAHEIAVLQDFETLYADFPHYFYPHLFVPLTEQQWQQCVQAYDHANLPSETIVDYSLLHEKIEDATYHCTASFDFLPLALQQQLLRDLVSDQHLRSTLKILNARLLSEVSLLQKQGENLAENNALHRDKVQQKFGSKIFVDSFTALLNTKGEKLNTNKLNSHLLETFAQSHRLNFTVL